jgi:acetaldehyde dehydrogenase (acetylating)
VNTPTTHGSIGLTTGLDPAMTLGCGGFGGNITSDNISPLHLLNIKRLAYEVTPAVTRRETAPAAPPPLPKAPAPSSRPGLAAESLSRRIDEFLATRGYSVPSPWSPSAQQGTPHPTAPARPVETTPAVEKPAEFVCEDDVRQAIRQGRKITIGEKSIVTPSARDLGEQHRLFVQAAWSG